MTGFSEAQDPVTKQPFFGGGGIISTVNRRTCQILTIAILITVLIVANIAISAATLPYARDAADDNNSTPVNQNVELQPLGLPSMESTNWRQLSAKAQTKVAIREARTESYHH